MTDYMGLQLGGDQGASFPMLNPGQPYFLMKSSSIKATQDSSGNYLDNLVSVTFEVDPSKSKIVDEHVRLANYLKERYLTIDIFDAQTKFFFGSCKIPLFEILR
jgi:hypothetical protein